MNNQNCPTVQKNDLEDTEAIIRQLYKVDSKIRACPILAIFRENRRLIAALERKIVELRKELETR
jgi:restriction endonuclease S subunit